MTFDGTAAADASAEWHLRIFTYRMSSEMKALICGHFDMISLLLFSMIHPLGHLISLEVLPIGPKNQWGERMAIGNRCGRG